MQKRKRGRRAALTDITNVPNDRKLSLRPRGRKAAKTTEQQGSTELAATAESVDKDGQHEDDDVFCDDPKQAAGNGNLNCIH